MKLGGLDISSVKLGTNTVNAVYLGSNLVWQNAPVATAATGIGQTSFTANWNAYTGATYYLLDVSTSSSFTTFVYENQITTSTSYVVIGLQSNTTYYYRVRANVGYDSDAQAFFDRVTTAGGSLSTTEQDAVNTLVIQMKTDGIWTKMKAIYPMVGASAAACSQNLKSSSFTGTFTSGWTFASTGVTPNGTSAYMDTNYNASISGSLNSAHISIYSRTDTFNSGEDMGTYGNNGQQLGYRYGVSDNYLAFNSIEYATTTIFTPTTGLLTFTRVSSSTAKVFHKNNTPYVDNQSSTSLQNANLFIGALNRNGTGFLYSNKQFAFSSIGDGLTDTEASNLYTAVQAFQTTLGRQV